MSLTSQNELLDCMYEVYIDNLHTEVNTAQFIAIEADETTDVSCLSQFAIILRFVQDNVPVERFLKYVDVDDRSAVGLSGTLRRELFDFNIVHKLIAQTYDGANVMSGENGVQGLMRSTYPHAHYIHCFAHQLNLVLKSLAEDIQVVRLFFTNLAGFSSYFSVSPKRSDVLRASCSKLLPSPSHGRWNFQTCF